MEDCSLDCLAADAFDFAGVQHVTTVNIKNNNFAALPEELLWNLTSLKKLHAETLR